MIARGEVIAQVHRGAGRAVATLAGRLGDLDVAEEVAAEAFAATVERRPLDGVPPNPGAWLTATAVRKAVDRRRCGASPSPAPRSRDWHERYSPQNAG